MLSESKLSFCGLNCDDCGLKEGIISNNVNTLLENLKQIALYNSLAQFSKEVNAFQYEQEFYSFLMALNKNLGNCKGCTSNSGFPFCKVRKCASEKGIKYCTECEDFSECELVKGKLWLNSIK